VTARVKVRRLPPPLEHAEQVELVLPVPPSVNGMYTAVRGRLLLSAEGRLYKRAVYAAYVLGTGSTATRFPTGPVRVTVLWYRARKSGDLDNRLKALLDSVKGLAWTDDAQVVEIHAYRHDDAANPRIVMTVDAGRRVSP
jgi:crossover junction endodeoxyribonuclease RusA